MDTVEAVEIHPLREDHFTAQAAGETAKLISRGVVLHSGLAEMMPQPTHLTPLTSVGDEHVYHIAVRGYTVEKFRQVVLAYIAKNFEEAERLIETVRPKQDWGRYSQPPKAVEVHYFAPLRRLSFVSVS